MAQDPSDRAATSSNQQTADLIEQLRQSEATLAELLHPNSSI